MRPLGTEAAARAAARHQRPVWLLSLTGDGFELHAATRAVTCGGTPYAPLLGTHLRWREALQTDDHAPTDWPGGLASAWAEVEVRDTASDDAGLRAALDTTPPLGLVAVLRLGWLAPESHELADEAAITLLTGVVTEWELSSTGVKLKLADELAVIAPQMAGRLLRREMLGNVASPWYGLPLPLVIGAHTQLPLVPLERGLELRLSAPVAPDTRMFFLDSLEGLALAGSVQIGPERVDYTDLDEIHRLLGPAGYGVTRAMPWLAHHAGALVRQRPAGGFTWLVADHPCRAVHNVYADGALVAPAAWTTQTRLLGGRWVQTITLPLWPCDGTGRMAQHLTADVEGWADGTGALVENPADVLAWLLTESRLAGRAPERLDAASFATQCTRLAALGYRYARRVPGDATLGALLDSAAREAGLWLVGGERLSLVGWEPSPHGADIERTFDAQTILAVRPGNKAVPIADARAQLHGVRGGLPPEAIELLGPPSPVNVARAAFQFPPETIASGVIPRRFASDWLVLGRSVGTGTACRDLGELVYAHAGDTPYQVELTLAPGEARLRCAETIEVSHAALGLDHALGWVRAASFDLGDGPWLRLAISGPWCNEVLWQGPAGYQLRRYAFGGKADFILNGRPVARLMRNGSLRLRGSLTESATLPANAPAALWLDAAGLHLSALVNGAWRPWAQLTMTGDLRLRGTLREASSAAPRLANNGFGADSAGFWLASSRRHPGLEWREADGVLHLAGVVMEGLRL